MDFVPADDERPAGQWMEGYWAQIAPWAKYLAYLIWAYLAQELCTNIHWNNTFGWDANTRYFFAASLFFLLPLGLLGYFSFQFGQHLERALYQKDQWLLEKAFQFLHRFLVAGLIIGILWVLYLSNQWYTLLQIMSHTPFR